jgi:hypothetical protein
MTRIRRLAFVSAALLMASMLPSAVAAAPPAVDLDIASAAHMLSPADVRQADISNSKAGKALLQSLDADGSIELNRRPYRVFAFGAQRIVIDAKTPLQVMAGLNKAGIQVYEAIPSALPVAASAQSGYAVPPSSAWSYNTDGSFVTTAGTWKRTIFWTITVAWNYKACSTCTAFQYFRMFGKEQAATITGSGANEGFKRAWLEFDNQGNWGGSPVEFEFGEPEESYAGVANQTFTVGFGSNYNVSLGIGPLTAGGGTNTSYGGSMTKSSENWHPVVRTETASGGVQWCRYESAEFTGTKVISTRVSLRQAVNAQLGGWNILTGQQDFTSSCPSQI